MTRRFQSPRTVGPVVATVAFMTAVALILVEASRPKAVVPTVVPPAPHVARIPLRPAAYHRRSTTILPAELLAVAGRRAPQPVFRVLLSEVLQDGVLKVDCASGLLVTDPETHKLIAQVPGNVVYRISLSPDGGSLNGPMGRELPDGVRIVPIAHDTPLDTGTRSFYGSLAVSRGDTGLDVVNEVEQEDYIGGVVAGEAARSFPPEALKAQAVAARTYALSQLGNRAGKYDVVDTVADQVYTGAGQAWPSCVSAVEDTSGQVATYHGRPIIAYFSADCGGETRSNLSAGLASYALPYLKPVKDAPSGGRDYCAVSPKHTWTTTVTDEELVPKLDEGLDPNLRSVKDIRFSRIYSDGRVGEVTVDGIGDAPPPTPAASAASPEPATQNAAPAATATSAAPPPDAQPETPAVESPTPDVAPAGPPKPVEITHSLPAFAFRKAVGTTLLRSQIMTVKRTAGGWEFSGRGYGHGVGMCQWGACGMARDGIKYDRILKHYYTGIQLQPAAARNGTLAGVVRGITGKPLANARITLAGTDREAVSDKRGHFQFASLPAGTYDLIAIPKKGEGTTSYAWTVHATEITNTVLRVE